MVKQNTDKYVAAWKCWYDLGELIPTEFNSVEHTLNDLPEDGFQAMRLWYVNGKGRFISGTDHYFFQDHVDGIIFGQSNESYSSIQERYPGCIIKKGKHTTEYLSKWVHETMTLAECPVTLTPVPTPTL